MGFGIPRKAAISMTNAHSEIAHLYYQKEMIPGRHSARLKNSLRNARLKTNKADALLELRGVTAAPKGSETLGSAITEYLPLQEHLRATTQKGLAAM
jgi:hypothetical protein